jgi:hypothetical protein
MRPLDAAREKPMRTSFQTHAGVEWGTVEVGGGAGDYDTLILSGDKMGVITVWPIPEGHCHECGQELPPGFVKDELGGYERR